jgi:hypothetical protein
MKTVMKGRNAGQGPQPLEDEAFMSAFVRATKPPISAKE